jgi:hypothetical protein
VGRALLVLAGDTERQRALSWIVKAPVNTRVTFQGPQRSVAQNSRYWALLTDIATQILYHGMRLNPEDWRLIFLDALNREMRIVPSIDGVSFVNLGASSSKLSKAEMTDMMTIIEEWGARNGVVFHDQQEMVPA